MNERHSLKVAHHINEQKNYKKKRKLVSQNAVKKEANRNNNKSLVKKTRFYKILSPILVLIACLVIYFSVIVSSAPRSLKFVNDKIKQELDKKFDKKASIRDSLLSFTRYGTIKIALLDLRISYTKADLENFFQKKEDKYLIIPRIEIEISFSDILFMKFQPSKIKIINPKILIENIPQLFANESLQEDGKTLNLQNSSEIKIGQNTEKKINETNSPESYLSSTSDKKNLNEFLINKSKEQSNDQLSAILSFLQELSESSHPIENFEVENAKLLFRKNAVKNPDFQDCKEKGCEQEFSEILIKKSSIKILQKNENLSFSSKTTASFKGETETNFDFSCQLWQKNNANCKIQIANLLPNSFSDLDSRLFELNNTYGAISGNAAIKIENGKLKHINFKMLSDIGNFTMKNVFTDKIEFKNLILSGDYVNETKTLNFHKLDFDLISKISNQTEIGNPHLSLSGAFSLNDNQKKLRLNLSAQNILNQEIYRFWPLNLDQYGVRKWYLEHLREGIVENARTSLALTFDEKNLANLDEIKAQISFSSFELEYDKNFPKIKNLAGNAVFNKNSMNISLSKGNLLQTRISSATVSIDDFFAKNLTLKINGESAGNAADGLKHISNNTEFSSIAEKYLNGYSQNKFFILAPLSQSTVQNLDNHDLLPGFYIAIESAIFGLKNDFAKGDLLLKTEKKIGSKKFDTEIDLTGLSVDFPELGLHKNASQSGNLNFVVDNSKSDHLGISQIQLSTTAIIDNPTKDQKSKSNQKNKTEIEQKISGEIWVNLSNGSIDSLIFANKGFDKNNYKIFLENSEQKGVKLQINGSYLNAANLFESKFLKEIFKQNNNSKRNDIKGKIDISRVELLNKKVLRNVSFAFRCNDTGCINAKIQARYLKSSSMQIALFEEKSKQKNEKKDKKTLVIDGFVNEAGFIAEAIGISRLASGGDIKLKFREVFDEKIQDPKEVKNTKNLVSQNNSTTSKFEGEITLESPLTIFENESVKKLSKNTLFSKIKDQIFASEKTILKSGKAELSIYGKELYINSLVANNFKIGITAKGKFNFDNGEISLSGMIIPAYIINSLFGLGKIPIIGSLVSGILTGGEEGGGLFGLRYEFIKKSWEKEGVFTTNKVAAFVPTTIQNLLN